jgi:hypothetical protein
MSYVAGFKHDIFISYAHFDNEEDSQSIRWVSRFQADLKSALRQRLGVDPEIFFDTRDFGAHSHLDFLLENVRQSAAFLAVFSPSYVTRDFHDQGIGGVRRAHDCRSPDSHCRTTSSGREQVSSAFAWT